MDITITPAKLCGKVKIPSSKSISHRALICAALAEGKSTVKNISMSDDISATMDTLSALGAHFEINGCDVEVTGITQTSSSAVLDCCESGSTLRFMIPVACVLGTNAEFTGKGRLPQRPITIYTRELSKKGISFEYSNTMPFSVSGKLESGKFEIEGNVSSQFITGLLLALPLCSGDSEIVLTSHLESKPYVDITISCLKSFGIEISETDNGYFIKGGQKYKPTVYSVEADFSQAAFFIAANVIGNSIEFENLPDASESAQGDKKIIEIADTICYNKRMGVFDPIMIDASDIPDLVPILSVLCSLSGSVTYITNAERLKLKESDRLESTAKMITDLGGKIQKEDSGLTIFPVSFFEGGTVDSFNDHRIAMAAAVAATASKGKVIIKGFESIKKSYPDFLSDYQKLGGNVHNGIIMA